MLEQAARQRLLKSEARRRMESWLLSGELREYMLKTPDVVDRPARTGPYITISREAGAGGEHIARLVGRELGWDVLDKELLDFITARYQLPRDLLEFVDETKARFVHDSLRAFFTSRKVSQFSYIAHLERTLCLAAVHGKVVIVGRGAHCVLPRDSGLAVRIVALGHLRVDWTMARQGIDRPQAEKLVDNTDAGRRELCAHFFHRDIGDPRLFDLVINVERISAETAARQIIAIHEAVRATREV